MVRNRKKGAKRLSEDKSHETASAPGQTRLTSFTTFGSSRDAFRKG